MDEMNENGFNVEPSSSTNKFIFADAFYNGLAEDDNNQNENNLVDNNIPSQEVTNEQPIENNNSDFGNLNFLLSNNSNNNFGNNESDDFTPNIGNNDLLNTTPTIGNDESFTPSVGYQFDENGIVTADLNQNQEPIQSEFTFDSNGVVTEDLSNNTPNQEFKFDANGVVTADLSQNQEPVQSEFTFDSNGVVTEDSSNNTPSQEPEEKEETEEQKFTHFLLGNNVNFETVEKEPEQVLIPDTDIVSYNGPVDESLNVQTGIDKSLENFLFSRRTVAEAEEKEDEYAPYRKNIDPEEKQVYRATRRKQPEPINNKLFTNPYEPKMEIKEEVEEKNIDENIETKPELDIGPIYTEVKPEDEDWEPDDVPQPIVITEEVNYNEVVKYDDENVVLSNLLDELKEKSKKTGKISILAKYGDDFCSRSYVTNPAIGREREIKELGLILLTPEKSAILVGKPGIGKTSIVEGLAYRIQRNKVPNALKGYRIISVKTTSLLGTLPTGETRLQTLIDEIKDLDKIILFVDEIHMLMGATNESSLDFANMFKESLGRGSIKMIGATTSDEYERYVLRDKAFVRRFQRVDVAEPTKEQTVEILMGTLPKIEKSTGAKLKYTHYLQVEIMTFIVNITTEYKRVYGIGSRYPDICITLVSQAFSEAVFDNRDEVNILDIRNAIEHSKNIYPDVISKELVNFDERFKDLIKQEKED